eukprot:2228495-Prymnesium_polylepis.3
MCVCVTESSLSYRKHTRHHLNTTFKGSPDANVAFAKVLSLRLVAACTRDHAEVSQLSKCNRRCPKRAHDRARGMLGDVCLQRATSLFVVGAQHFSAARRRRPPSRARGCGNRTEPLGGHDAARQPKSVGESEEPVTLLVCLQDVLPALIESIPGDEVVGD